MVTKAITRDDYRAKLFTPLSSTFGVPIAFNGESNAGRIAGGRTLGIYVHADHAIVIRYRDCPVSLFKTVAHEIGHATDPSLSPEALSSVEPQLHGGHRSYEEAVARFVSYYSLCYAGVKVPSEKVRADELLAKHERVYRRYKTEPLKLHILNLMEIAEVIAFVAKPGRMELLDGWSDDWGSCKFCRDYPKGIRPCKLLAEPVVEKAGGRAAARRKNKRKRSKNYA
ncbi:MAG: hypothetical protein LBJ48_00130 [Coriobacteriales bacterium]|jgi:hypothetical protein|nr:hypothetical protein [Coriobacteriales bacterium]